MIAEIISLVEKAQTYYKEKIGTFWIEVSNFKTDYKNYFSNIEEKREVVEASGYDFFFVTSEAELKELVSLM